MRRIAGVLLLILQPLGFADPGLHPQTHPDLLPLQLQGFEYLRQGKYSQAASVWRTGLSKARSMRHDWSVSRFLANLGSYHLATFRYRAAMRTYLEAAKIAERAGDPMTLASILGNIAQIYAATGAFSQALDSAERGLAVAVRTVGQDPDSPRIYVPQLRVRVASVRAAQGDMEAAITGFGTAIQEADALGDPIAARDTKAWALSHLGSHLLRWGDLARAEEAIAEDLRLRQKNRGRGLQYSLLNAAMLHSASGEYEKASALYEAALAAARRAGDAVTLWKAHYRRGQLRAAQGRVEDAVRDHETAIDLAGRWRVQMLPADAVRIDSAVEMHELYASYVDSATELYLRTRSPELPVRALRVLEEHRAASLRATATNLEGWERRLPAAYGEKLAELRAVEAKLLAGDSEELRAERDRLRAAVVQMEAAAGIEDPKPADSVRTLADARIGHRLRPDQLLLSFHVGEKASSVWAVSGEEVLMRRLPPRNVLASKVLSFSEAVRLGSDSAARLGAGMFRELFGGIESTLARHRSLVLSLDDALFEMPFAAIVERFEGERPVYMVEQHELQIVPSALAIAPLRVGPLEGGFLGVGDAIYNAADPRWRGPGRSHGLELPRLPGSRREIAGCAASWPGPPKPVLLDGSAANTGSLKEALRAGPAVCHFAGHIVQGQHSRDRLIALSITPNGDLDLPGPREIASWTVRARLVVLSGCNSGRDEVLPGAGLAGLTRAWLAAGAGSVIASLWPAPDDAGELFTSFYARLRCDPLQRPAAALREAQMRMLRSGTWRAQPKYWAAYFTVGR